MKKISLLFVMMFACMAMSAQITWNVKAGAGIATVTGLNGDGETLTKVGWKIGVGIEKPLSANWLIMPTLEFKQKGCAWKEIDREYDYWLEEDVNVPYVQLPVLAAYRLRLNDEMNLTLKAGPYFAYALSAKCKYKEYWNGEMDEDEYDLFDSSDIDEETSTSRFDCGLALGADVEYHRFVVGAEVEYGLIPVVKNNYENMKIRNISAYITVGYKF